MPALCQSEHGDPLRSGVRYPPSEMLHEWFSTPYEIYGGEEDTHRPNPAMTSYESMLQL